MTESAHYFIPPATPLAVIDAPGVANVPGASRGEPEDFREHWRNLSPIFLLGDVGTRLTGGLALLFDALADAATYAVQARYMLSAEFPRDAVPRIGKERMLPRYPGEGEQAYYERVYDAWRIWESAGTDDALVEQFLALGFTATIKTVEDWNWDNRPEDWSRFWVVLTEAPSESEGTLYASEGTWGDGKIWGDGGTWGSTVPHSVVSAARMIVRSFKPGHMRCQNIVLVLDEGAFTEPDGTWGDPGNRSEAAAYWDG